MIEKFIQHCQFCKRDTLCIISQVSRKRGVKTTCLICGKQAKFYTKSKLKEESVSMSQVGTAPLIPTIKTALELEQEQIK